MCPFVLKPSVHNPRAGSGVYALCSFTIPQGYPHLTNGNPGTADLSNLPNITLLLRSTCQSEVPGTGLLPTPGAPLPHCPEKLGCPLPTWLHSLPLSACSTNSAFLGPGVPTLWWAWQQHLVFWGLAWRAARACHQCPAAANSRVSAP